jgi:hypothetical protein
MFDEYMLGGIGSVVRDIILTSAELDLLDRLPGPPAMARIRTTNVWIVEWLHPQDQMTGKLLHGWLQGRRPNWSAYVPCKTKAHVLAAIERATVRAQQSQIMPLLHLEAHGDEIGLGGPDGFGGSELLSWDELADPLQRLNLATACNLVVLVAACTGFAGIKAFYRGPRAPAVALVGPTGRITEGDLLRGTKEFYRRWCDEDPRLADVVESASTEAGRVGFDMEPFAILAFEAMAEALIVSLRPDERSRRAELCRQRMRALQEFSDTEIEHRLSLLPAVPTAVDLQAEWDRLFMIDLWPENREQFGVDMTLLLENLLGGEHAVPLLSP